MLFGYFTLLVALIIETVGAYYSITGLAAIFSGAVVPILIMGASLEVGKVTAAVWLKMYWDRASLTYKLYLVPAVAFLMLLTSMGIFGFLSKAHSDQSLVSGDSMAKVAIYDEKIKTSKDNIDANRKALKQMDEAVDQVMARSDDEKGADKAVAIRRSQQKERARLLAEIEVEQRNVAKVSEERAPFAAEFRKVESEVGPIKYIAALIYGDNPDANILERAVRWVIILIVAVFDPLALVLILAAQQTLRWAKQDQEEKTFTDALELKREVAQALDEGGELPPEDTTVVEEPEKSILESHPYLFKPFSHFRDTTPLVYKPEEVKVDEPLVVTNSNPEDNVPVVNEPDLHVYDDERLVTPHDKKILAMGIDDVERPGDYLIDNEKVAMREWKAENPDDTVKHQRRLYNQGLIDKLPWEEKIVHSETFGDHFPEDPLRGDTHVLTIHFPNQLYKFNGNNWMIVDKAVNNNYTYDTAYIDHLINKIDSGEYDPELLSDNERDQIADRLNQK